MYYIITVMSEEKNRFSALKENSFKKKPLKNDYKKKDEKSSSEGYEPRSNNYQPRSNNYQPRSNNYQPRSNNYQPRSNNYQPNSNNRNKFRRTKRDYNNSNEVKPVIGKFRQVGIGEVSFMPQLKKSNQENKKKENKLVPLKKKEEEPVIDDDDIALTLAFAEKYQYITESEEEGEEEED